MYENPNLREWIDRSRQKIAIALHSLGDDVDPRSRSSSIRDDRSMREDGSEDAEVRRRMARAEIMERGRIMEERTRRKKNLTRNSSDSSHSFDSMVDVDGKLRKGGNLPDVCPADSQGKLSTLESSMRSEDKSNESGNTWATTTAMERGSGLDGLTNRNPESQWGTIHDSVDSPIALRKLSPRSPTTEPQTDPFITRYEQEMRDAWNLPLPLTENIVGSSHASESLIDFTPTSELPPDPDVSVPDITHGSQYFSAAASASSHTMSNVEPEFYYAHPANPGHPVEAAPAAGSRSQIQLDVSSAPSIAGSMDHVHASDVDDSEDGVMSEVGDGVHTPASAWTEVGSVVSSDAGH